MKNTVSKITFKGIAWNAATSLEPNSCIWPGLSCQSLINVLQDFGHPEAGKPSATWSNKAGSMAAWRQNWEGCSTSTCSRTATTCFHNKLLHPWNIWLFARHFYIISFDIHPFTTTMRTSFHGQYGHQSSPSVFWSVLVTSKASGIITRSTMVDANAACMATNPASRPGRSSQIRFWHVGNCGDRGRWWLVIFCQRCGPMSFTIPTPLEQP